MSTWVIISWVVVAVLTIVNVVVFLKLKQASEQMMKMAFPGAKDMNQALQQMQAQMAQMGQSRGPGKGGRGGGSPFAGGRGPGSGNEAQLKAAMEMLKNLQPKGKS